MLLLFGIAIPVMLVAAGLLTDGGYLAISIWHDQEELDAAVCGIAAGASVSTPATITIGNAEVWGEHTNTSPAFLMQLVGFSEYTYTVRARCLRPRAGMAPIAVKELWLDGEGHPILGQDMSPGESQCDTCKGADFVGAVLPWYVCDGLECDTQVVWPPAEETNSPQTAKDLFHDFMLGSISAPTPPIGTRIPQVNGVSNKFLVDAMIDGGYGVGDELVVLVFDGSVQDVRWENVEIMYYAVFTITEFTANSMSAEYVERIDDISGVLAVIQVRQVPWDWTRP